MNIYPNTTLLDIFYNNDPTVTITEYNNNRLSKKLIILISYHIPQNKNINQIIIKSDALKNIASLLLLYNNLHYHPNLSSLRIHRILYKNEITEIKKLYETCPKLIHLDTNITNLRKLINNTVEFFKIRQIFGR